VLFQADSEMAQIAQHVGHDGFPPPLRELSRRGALGPLAELLFSTLRQDPSNRPSAAVARKELARIAPTLKKVSWPFGA
jgi:hypothetical protein